MGSWSAYLDSSLVYIGLTTQDIAFRDDYTIRDEYRFAIVDELLVNPLGTIDFLIDMDVLFWTSSEEKILNELVGLYDHQVSYTQTDFETALKKCYGSINNAFEKTPVELSEVFEELSVFSPELTSSIEQEREETEQNDSLVNFLKEHAGQVDYKKLFTAQAYLLCAASRCLVWFEQQDTQPQSVEGVEGNVLYYKRYEFGEIIVADTGKNVYKKDFAVIIDLGGDDIYRLGAQTGKLHLIIDRAGDDQYEGDNYAIACGHFGVSILIDEQGNDIYRAKSFSIGCGVFGVGLLTDKVGNDTYYGDTFTQGVGGFGIGILRDEDGNDLYQGALYAQGFASTYGIGILGDKSGNDRYIIREEYTDEIRYLDHYLSLSQGFSIGFRPDLSAGIGIILERGGNDYYLADIFGQGASYWYGIGAIVDDAGNDSYVAYQYAQGSGVHIALGALVDMSGDDNYVAKGVSQGCGHDLALGILYDIQGDDSYVAFDLSQGAGNANGVGLLIDESGDDVYSVRRVHNTQGYGNFRREYGSIGILIDIAGKDTYYNGKDATFWKKGEYGIGIDWE